MQLCSDPASSGRFSIDRQPGAQGRSSLAGDVRRGLSLPQKAIPPKYFYDDRGSKLFDAICDLPEYYLTRSEQALLGRIACGLIERTNPTDLIELGAGSARKTRLLLDAADRLGREIRYVPMDVSEAALSETAQALLHEYPLLRVHAIAGDFEKTIDRIPESGPNGGRRLALFIGSSIGNYGDAEATAFLRRLSGRLTASDYFLLGTDLVKGREELEAAYDDAAGVTAEFNKNLLRVINRELPGTNFEPESFEHVAVYNEAASQIEIYLRSLRRQTVRIPALSMEVSFEKGERMLTEISRKYTRESVERLLAPSGFRMREWYSERDRFGLCLSTIA